MKELIEIFRMSEIDPKTRARVIIKLGIALNNQMAANYTESIVFELVSLLDPDNDILTNERYSKHKTL